MSPQDALDGPEAAAVGAPTPAMRVEQALRVLPEVDVLAGLRTLVIAQSRGQEHLTPQLTVDKRVLRPDRLPELLPEVVAEFTTHLEALYAAAVSALAAEAAADSAGAARRLLDAGALEERMGREAAARLWYEHAQLLGAEAFDRGPEIGALLALAELDLDREALEPAARRAQRAYTLAEAARLDDAAAAAALVLARVARRAGELRGATSWLTRSQQFGKAAPALQADAHLEWAELVGDNTDDAQRHLKLAHGSFTAAADHDGIARVRVAQAQALARTGELQPALLHFDEALAHLQRGSRHPRLECTVRRALAAALLDAGRLVEAEDEARRAEQLAVARGQGHELIRLYLLLGAIRAAQADETGFVFFEKALDLSRVPTPLLGLEALTYAAYAQFRKRLGDADEAVEYARRAAEIREQLAMGWAPGR